jgi:hypothetical protein
MVYSSHDEDMSTLEEMFFPSDEGEASTSGVKSEECKAVLRSGTYVPERQAPKDFDKGKDKVQNKDKEDESFNKTLINIMKKTVDGNQRDWDNRLQEALWTYRTTYQTPT